MKSEKQSRIPLIAAFCVAVAVFAVVPGAGDAFEAPKRLVWTAVATVLAGWALFRPQSNAAEHSRIQSVFLLILAGWMVLRCLIGGFQYRSLVPLCIWMLPIVAFLVASAMEWDEVRTKWMFRTVFFLGVFEAVLMLLQRFGLDPFLGTVTRAIEYAPGRMIGTIGYQNQAAEFLGLALISLFFAKISKRWTVLAGGIIVTAMVFTANRAAIVGLAVTGGIFVLAKAIGRLPLAHRESSEFRVQSSEFRVQSSEFRVQSSEFRVQSSEFRVQSSEFRVQSSEFRVIIGLVLVAVLCAGIPEVRKRACELVRPSRSIAVQSRSWMWKAAIRLWHENPVLGVGPGEFAYRYMESLGDVLPEKRTHKDLHALVFARETHFDLLQFGAEFGIVGLVLVLYFVALIIKRKPKCGYFILYTAVCSCFNFSWQTSVAGPLTGLLAGMQYGSMIESGNKNKWQDLIVFLLAVSLFTVCVSEILHIPSRGKFLADKASAAAMVGDYKTADEMFEKAVKDYVSPEVLKNYAFAEFKLGKYDSSYEIYSMCARSGLGYFDALKNMSVVAEKKGDISAAAINENERFELDKGAFSDNEIYRLAVLHFRNKDYSRAFKLIKSFRKHCRKTKPNAWTPEWDNLTGTIYLKLNDVSKAERSFQEALRRKPGLESARRNLEALQRNNR